MPDMTKDEIIERLIELDIDHNPRDNKAVLEELLEAHEDSNDETGESSGTEDDVRADFVRVTVTKAGDGKIFTGLRDAYNKPVTYERRTQFWCAPEKAQELEDRHYVEIED